MQGIRIFLSALTLALLALAMSAASAAAAIARKDAPVSPEQASNPKADPQDIILPMPCGLSMALRAVAVPGGLMHDRRIVMGLGNTDPERQLYERRFESHIAAPFTTADLPAAWQSRLDPNQQQGFTFYFLGKYEVSQYQWDAVMQESCPAGPPAEGDLPRREISWFDVQRFLQKYNAWLVANHPDKLPRFVGNENNIGFLRLPTEEEWEFAARGGSRVPGEDRDNNDIFPLGQDRLEDFGVFSGQSALTAPSAIGSRKAGPLQIYDTVGNVKEMVDGLFHFSVADMRENGEVFQRLHGAAGGMLCKGGSFRSTQQGVLPGWRDEVPLYTAKGETRPDDLGFRVALSGLNVGSGQRLATLKRENAGREAAQTAAATAAAQAGTGQHMAQTAPAATPLAELDRIAGTAPPEMQPALARLRNLLSDRQSAQERQRAEVLENTARALLYQAETIRGFAFRYFTLHANWLEYLEKHQGTDTNAAKQKIDQRLDEYYQLLLTAANYYKSTLARVSEAEPAEVADIIGRFRQEYSADDSLSRHMRENIASVDKHLKAARSQGIAALDQKQICRDIIPDVHLKALPLKKKEGR